MVKAFGEASLLSFCFFLFLMPFVLLRVKVHDAGTLPVNVNTLTIRLRHWILHGRIFAVFDLYKWMTALYEVKERKESSHLLRCVKKSFIHIPCRDWYTIVRTSDAEME